MTHCQEPNYVYDGDYEYDEYVPNGGAAAPNGGPTKVRRPPKNNT